MRKRTYYKIPSPLKVRFFCSHSFCAGTATSLSKRNMVIETKMALPLNGQFNVIICLREKLIKVPVKLKKMIGSNNSYDVMAVEILEPQKDYLDFVNSINPLYRKRSSAGHHLHTNHQKERPIKKLKRPQRSANRIHL